MGQTARADGSDAEDLAGEPGGDVRVHAGALFCALRRGGDGVAGSGSVVCGAVGRGEREAAGKR